MDKIYDLLLIIHNEENVTQRRLAEALNLSLGTVNTLLNYLEEQHFILIEKKSRNYRYFLTVKGEQKLKEMMKDVKNAKLEVDGRKRKINRAVILAAGQPVDLNTPAALIPIMADGTTVVERTMKLLTDRGIHQIDLVVGYRKDLFIKKFGNTPNVTLWINDDFSYTGTMSSLSKVFPELSEDFILVEGDLVYEEYILDQILTEVEGNAITCVNLSGSEDEAFVDMDEKGYLVRISKDIRQMNQLSAEMMGVSKISIELLKEIKNLYTYNNNQWLNYEYLILQAAQTYQVKCVLSNNVAWGDLDDNKSYLNIKNYILPTIIRHENQRQLQYAKEKLANILNVTPKEIKKIQFAGGMTNNNYQATVNDQEYFIRIPGKCTEVMINRQSEALNAQLGSALGLNVDTLYINSDTGIKVTTAIPEAETLSPRICRLRSTMKEIAEMLFQLHHSEIVFPNQFSFSKEWEKYEELVALGNATYYPEYEDVKIKVRKMTQILEQKYGLISRPCHNDLVAENFVRNGKNKRLYLLDWEYSGMNDPAWDLAGFTLESKFSPEELKVFLEFYYHRLPTEDELQKVKIFQVYQDILWSVWTIAKEAAGQDFGSYGIDRFLRGKKQLEEILYNEK